MKFEVKKIAEAGKSVAVVGGGLILGNAMKNLLMSPREDKKSIIPDTVITNGLVAAGALVGASFTKGTVLPILLASLSAYFGIRTINKGTESVAVSGLGNETVNSIVKAVNKWVPQLGNTDVPSFSSSDSFMDIVNRAALPPSNASDSMRTSFSTLVGINQGSGQGFSAMV